MRLIVIKGMDVYLDSDVAIGARPPDAAFARAPHPSLLPPPPPPLSFSSPSFISRSSSAKGLSLFHSPPLCVSLGLPFLPPGIISFYFLLFLSPFVYFLVSFNLPISPVRLPSHSNGPDKWLQLSLCPFNYTIDFLYHIIRNLSFRHFFPSL